jgi:hypothetical protein
MTLLNGGIPIVFTTNMTRSCLRAMFPLRYSTTYPELFGALDCRITSPPEAVAELRHQLVKKQGPASKHQTFLGLTPKFNICATEIYENGCTNTHAGAWDIFV